MPPCPSLKEAIYSCLYPCEHIYKLINTFIFGRLAYCVRRPCTYCIFTVAGIRILCVQWCKVSYRTWETQFPPPEVYLPPINKTSFPESSPSFLKFTLPQSNLSPSDLTNPSPPNFKSYMNPRLCVRYSVYSSDTLCIHNVLCLLGEDHFNFQLVRLSPAQ